MEVVTLNRTLDQELLALMRGASLECPACGEFVLHKDGSVMCPECGSGSGGRENRRYTWTCRPGDRGPRERLEESPDTAGQDAGEIPGGESRRKVAQKGDRHRRTYLSGDAGGKGEKVG